MKNAEGTKKVFTNPFEIDDIRRFHELSENIKGKPRICSEHHFPIVYDYEYTGNSDGMPYSSVILNGCCNKAIEKEIEFINLKLKENQQI